MIRVRSQNELVALLITVIALLLALVTGIYAVMTMKPPRAANVAALQASRDEIRTETTKNKAELKTAEAKLNAVTWTASADVVSSTSLAKVSALAKIHNLTLMAFRPQKQAEVGGLTQLPFLILVDGPFPAVMQFVKDVDRKDTRLAVSLVQLASADEATDRVSATIGAAAYLKPQKGATVGNVK